MSDKLKLRKLLVDNPIDAWTGEANSSPFIFQDDVFGLETMPTIDLAPALSELLIETVDWRLVEYLSRRELGPEPSSSESLAVEGCSSSLSTKEMIVSDAFARRAGSLANSLQISASILPPDISPVLPWL